MSETIPDPGHSRAEQTLDDLTQAHVEEVAGAVAAARADQDALVNRHEFDVQRKRNRRTDKQLAFLFGLLVICFLLLAYRTESNDEKLAQVQYSSCVARVQQAEQANQGRQVLINLVASSPPQAGRTPEEKQVIIQQLQDGLFLPIENCGQDPS